MAQRCEFRTFHSAANYAYRLRDIDGCLTAINGAAGTINDEVKATLPEDILKLMYHAEAHAHECDAAYPAGTMIEMGNGPNIIDETGNMRAFMSQAPQLQTARDVYGRTVCKECNEETVHQFPASDDA
jgi:hypothetical protein